jgi:hypothetical protein
MTELAQSTRTAPAAAAERATPGAIATLPFVGVTTIEDVAFYTVLGAVTAIKLVSWPTAALIGSAHVLHQRARNMMAVSSERAEILEGALEATEDLV